MSYTVPGKRPWFDYDFDLKHGVLSWTWNSTVQSYSEVYANFPQVACATAILLWKNFEDVVFDSFMRLVMIQAAVAVDSFSFKIGKSGPNYLHILQRNLHPNPGKQFNCGNWQTFANLSCMVQRVGINAVKSFNSATTRFVPGPTPDMGQNLRKDFSWSTPSVHAGLLRGVTKNSSKISSGRPCRRKLTHWLEVCVAHWEQAACIRTDIETHNLALKQVLKVWRQIFKFQYEWDNFRSCVLILTLPIAVCQLLKA